MTACYSWSCVSNCGACCRLDPAQRPEALEALSTEQKQTYLKMVGSDGWCIHFDTGSRRCRSGAASSVEPTTTEYTPMSKNSALAT